MQPQAHLDTIGWTYMGLSIGWTVLLAVGMLFLWQHRDLPTLQIRRLPILFAGVTSLHCYGAVVLLIYVIGPITPCTAEFWIMSLYLPFGIAMFQAANSQFLHIASRQKQFARMSALSDPRPVSEKDAERLASSRMRRIIRGVERADKIDRMMVWIGIGLFLQVYVPFLTLKGIKTNPGRSYSLSLFSLVLKSFIPTMAFLITLFPALAWKPDWIAAKAGNGGCLSSGSFSGHGSMPLICCGSPAEYVTSTVGACRRSAAAWLGTSCAVTICTATDKNSLPASPLWLAGLYSPQMASVSQYFPPPSWFSVSIFLMEVATIGFPVVQVFKTKKLRKETLNALSAWEKKQDMEPTFTIGDGDDQKDSTYTGSTYAPGDAEAPEFGTNSTEMLNMAALDFTLRTNPGPLLEFAALKDFSGENVSFLMHLADWKRAWFIPLSSTEEQRRQQFFNAVRLYVNFVSLDFAEFPINICSREMKRLHQVFGEAATLLMRRPSVSSTETVTPFDNPIGPVSSNSSELDLKTGLNLSTLGKANLASVMQMTELRATDSLSEISIPDSFTTDIFQDAEQEIKYLILTNTWPKFVNVSCSGSQVDEEEGRGGWWARHALCNA